ncbi:GPI mannosyltransferase 3-like [Sinocyclocheilus grahami]|uniref:GPI mannosyltransferase 3-like n=1 Tax=Sinocyclocheilus grahami TaxID=75366 RepID=UPI0007ACA17E|nr:PREDICTED: GPI mannosyltransferase 3-like [Sinocyclocheilus grahami]
MYKLLHLMNYDTVYLLVFVPRIFQALLAAYADVMLYNLVLRWENSRCGQMDIFLSAVFMVHLVLLQPDSDQHYGNGSDHPGALLLLQHAQQVGHSLSTQPNFRFC